MTVDTSGAVTSKDAVGSKRKVFIVDDHPIVREGLAQMINREPDLAVCGDAQTMHEALEAIEVHKPHILIVDISLNGPDGLDSAEKHPRQGSESSSPDPLDAR